MTGQLKKPKQALNKAYLKLKPTRAEIEIFKKNLIVLIDKIDNKKNEEHTKLLFRDFLRDTYYKDLYEINVKDRNDLVIHSEKTSASPVSVIIEAKRPSEKYDFPTVNNLNVKAMHELVLYYLRERADCSNSDIRHLIATNGYEWFIFDSQDFHRYFYSNSALLKEYNDWNNGKKDSSSTQMFYNDIARKYISEIKNEIPFTYFNINDYDKYLRNENKEDDRNLIPLYKLLSPSHLLKLSFSNDSNSLDKNFYFELLHIIGLEETKDGSKKIIKRKKDPDEGSLLENAINILKSDDRLHKVKNPDAFGKDKEDQYFGLALELCITWMNRVLFLKLLEAQLIKYHKGDKEYKFLTFENIGNFDSLNKLFFQVLAVKPESRGTGVKSKFAKIPYLNSSLFEMSGLEDDLIRISNLEDDPVLPILSKTVLKGTDSNKKTGKIKALQYLFDFLDSYDFSSEGSEDILEERKTLINASVLGLIFEKINGYKDGSFFTPGFITMYMCRETIRRAVIQKFNDAFKTDIKDFGELKNFVGVPYKKDEIRKYNEVINSLKICDPAVGSGHFLVSALNEIIAVKSELNLLSDSEGNRLVTYSAFVENDELMLVNTLTGDLFEYIPGNPESQRIQEALFHEKQTIIENCLFGVDINHNSVKICRLRLWIELLKNAYYTKESGCKELETLPNIDINIKCGNSLVSRFALDADLSSALRKSKWTISSYRLAVQSYQNAKTKDEKRELERLINEIKSNFRTYISDDDPKQKKLNNLENELYEKFTSKKLFDVKLTDKEKAKEEKDKLKLIADIEKYKAEIKEIKESAVYRNAFEWRFEFPEVLDEKGSFIGFDVVIGNPPYIRQEELTEYKLWFKKNMKLYSGLSDIYIFFIEKGFTILKKYGLFNYIMPNKFLIAGYGESARNFLLTHQIINVIDFGDIQVFNEATTYPLILIAVKDGTVSNFDSVKVNALDLSSDFNSYVELNKISIPQHILKNDAWIISDQHDQKLLERIKSNGVCLEKYIRSEAKRGIVTGLTEAFTIDENTKQELINKNKNNGDVIKPLLQGRDIQPYITTKQSKYLLFIPWHFPLHTNPSIIGASVSAELQFKKEYPDIFSHLSLYKEKLSARNKAETGIRYEWYAMQRYASDYYKEFEKPKIMYQVMQVKPCFVYDEDGMYCNNSIWFIPTEDKVLLGILNSKIGWWLISKHCTAIQNGYQLIWDYFRQIPIVCGTLQQRNIIAELVNQVLKLKKENHCADVSELINQIDKLVYQLYGLTEEEIKIVERG